MKVKLSLRRTSGSVVDIVVTADSTATVEDVATAIADSDPLSSMQARAGGVRLTLAVTPPTSEELVPLEPDALIAEAPIGSGFVASVAVIGGPAAPHREGEAADAPVAAILRVHTGPHAGREFPLPAGHSIIGRDRSADVVLDDPLVSKRHARLEVGASSVELVDLRSANGIVVDGGSVFRLRLDATRVVTIGDTDISVVRLGSFEALGEPVLERGGGLMFNRSPRVEIRYPGTEFPHPQVPTEASPRLFPWPMIVAPILLGITMYVFTGRLLALVVVAMSPLMMLGNFVGQRTQQGQTLKREVDTFELQIERLEEDLGDQRALERRRRRAEAPAVAEVYEAAMQLGPMLWTRRPEHWNFLAVRLGLGRARSRNTVAAAGNNKGIPEYVTRVADVVERHRWIDDVPVLDLLTSAGAIGVAGPREASADALRGLCVQLFGLHAPNEVVTAAIVDPGWTGELQWMKWLPHTSSPRSPFAEMALADSPSAGGALLSGLEELVLERLSGTATRRGPLGERSTSMQLGSQVGETAGDGILGDVAMVLIVSADAPVDRPRLTQMIERGPDAGIYTIFVGPTVESLPAVCRTFLDTTGGLDDARIGFVRAGEEYTGVQVEGVSNAYAQVFAKRLAPVVDSSSVAADASDLPSSVSLVSLIGHDLADTRGSAVERWRQNNSILDRTTPGLPRLRRAGTLKAFVGQGSPDAMTLDLRTQGPHALVGGTTGSGKSEFLQAWVLGMAAEYSPDRVSFLFVDYKGGSAFADCVELPHCVGLVTDLSPHLVRRALTSLRAELHHREHLFNRKKAKDLLELEKRRDPETPPALVLVIDEFAALAGEVPEFVDGVVDIAQRGRSLGIHLIMATQRPAGVIKDNLRANTNLRVALRMADESDSKDVVGDPIAGTFDPSIPGRGIAKTGPGRLVAFQSAYAGGWTAATKSAAEVRVAELRFGSVVVWEAASVAAESESHDADLGPNDQKRIVRTLIDAAESADIPAPRRPWLDDLEEVVELTSLPLDGDGRIVLGRADIPERQLQEPVYFDPDSDGHLLVYGTSGSGKSTMLRSFATAIGARPETGGAEVYGFDFGTGSLRALETLPHVGSIVSGDDAERVQRLLTMLRGMLDDRARRFSSANASSLTDYRRLAGKPDEPRVLLLIDGFATFKKDWETSSARAGYYNVFMRILGEGRPLGVHAVVSADRYGAVPTAVSANVSRRLVLRMSDDSAYAMLGAPRDVLSDRSVPGRAIVDGYETQLAVIGGTTNVARQTAALEVFAASLRTRGAREVPEVGALPTQLDLRDLPDSVDGMPVIGVSDDILGPRGFEPVGTFVVTGPPRSGKTTALRGLITAMERFDPSTKFFHIGGRRAALRDYRPWTRAASAIDDVRALAKELVEVVRDESIGERLVVVIENVTEFADSDAERPLKELFQSINRSDHFLMGDGDVTGLSSGYGFIGDFKGGRRGIVLKPDSYDGDSLFKVPFPRVQRHEFPEGRGLFVENGRFVTVQMPDVEAVPR